MSLEQIIESLADSVVQGLDERPEWLKWLPGATDLRELYYAFLYHLALGKNWSCLEIGTRQGTSALHLAAGMGNAGTVLTLDIEPGCKPLVESLAREHALSNVVGITGDSSTIQLDVDQPLDLLFIDGNHTFESSFGDYRRFAPLVRPNGLILFDDTKLNEGMASAWSRITEPKIELAQLHYMGFGVVVKS